MIYKTFRHVLLGFAVLASVPAAAQEFDSELKMSTDTVYWYRICSAIPGMEDYAMTDANGAVNGEDQDDSWLPRVYMLQTETEDFRSQWKLTAGKDGKVIITNRATENQINSSSVNVGDHNYTQLTPQNTSGFTITALGDNAFKMESMEDDGINRCLALAEASGEALSYPESGESSSFIGWKFFPIEIDTGVGQMKEGSPVIRVAGKHITVTGSSDWQLFNAQGELMPRTVSLPTGVYMVKLPQGTVKVAIP